VDILYKDMEEVIISLIIPTYNAEAFIAETIETINQQTFQSFEIIIVDDGSTDATVSTIKKQARNSRLIHQNYTGKPTTGRNKGVQAARGKFIAFLDHDDLWPKNKLELHFKNMQENPHADIVVGTTQIFRFKPEIDPPEMEYLSEAKHNLLLSASLIKKSVFEKIGFFDESLKYWGSDGDWFLRAREKGVGFHFHNDVTLNWRFHDFNTSSQEKYRNLAIIEILKNSLDRRRQNNSGVFNLIAPILLQSQNLQKGHGFSPPLLIVIHPLLFVSSLN